MKANVQYNDFRGTTAADRSDLFCEFPESELPTIINEFKVLIDSNLYSFRGISVYGTNVEETSVTLFFEDKRTCKIKKYYCEGYIPLQKVFDLFKRFEFQIGIHLDDINENEIETIE
ncbi:MAG: hypothetical protein J6V33_00805 [Bacteroidales bacterium]|nr:hypothetical protein [Bacteroidales bacterium]